MSTNFCFQKFVNNSQQCFAFTPQANFPPILWIFTEGEGDGIETRLPFKKILVFGPALSNEFDKESELISFGGFSCGS